MTIVLSVGKGSRFFLRALKEGTLIVTLPGDDLCMAYTPGCFFVAATLSPDNMDEQATRALVRSGLHPTPLNPDAVAALALALHRVHCGASNIEGVHIGRAVLTTLTGHLAGEVETVGVDCPTSQEAIVQRAMAFIEARVSQPISIKDIASAAESSQRTLYRAFLDVLGEPPSKFIRRLRLHRIRGDLVSLGSADTVSAITYRWGIREPGRMSGWYRDMFGELPSTTAADKHRRQQQETWL